MHTRANKQKSTQNLNITNSIEVTIIDVARRAVAMTKKSCFFHFQFLLASSRTTSTRTAVINNNFDDQEAQAPSIRF